MFSRVGRIFLDELGRFNADGKSVVNGVYLDKVKFTLVDAP